jgi:uncharacterized protein GlcG (DUF336 family)
MRLILSLSILICGAVPAGAAPLSLSATAAQAIVNGCASHASAKSQSHAIAVVDLGGRLVAALRMDGNGYGMMDFALAKAQAAAAWGFQTADMKEGGEVPGFARAPHVVTVAGGVPVYSADGSQRIGAAGASGEAPADDAACVEAGIKAAGLRSARAR